MAQKIKISFVLPCYNVDRYIADCLDSLLDQDMSMDDYEIVCVNDCSLDETRNIINDYRNRFPNIRLIDHDENQTVGGARNTGLNAAIGEFVWFVDPDDLIKPNVLNTVYDKCKDKQLDVFMFNHECVDEYLNHLENFILFGDTDVCTGQEFICKYFPNRLSELCIIWRCVFNRSFLQNSNVLFPTMQKAEDTVFLWKSLLMARNVMADSFIYYIYRTNPYSIAKQSKKAYILFSGRILMGGEVHKIITSNVSICPEIVVDIKNTLKWCADSSFYDILNLQHAELLKFYDCIKINKSAVGVMRKYMNRKNRVLFDINMGKILWILKIKTLKGLFSIIN